MSPLDSIDLDRMPWQVGATVRPCYGQIVAGDTYATVPCGSHMIVAVVDVLGHGPDAHDVAKLARQSLEGCIVDDPVAVIERLHRDLRGTRGAAATVCVLSESRVEGCGVGNCEVQSNVAALSPLLGNGVIGTRLGRPRRFAAPWSPGDRLVIFSDGVRSRDWPASVWTEPPPQASQLLVNRYGREGDDATALVVQLGR